MTAIAIVRALLRDMKPGEPKSEGAITLVPFFASKRTPDYLLGAEAIAAGALKVHEHGGGQVPQLVAINDAPLPVLLLDGEHLEGAMQNRILNVAVMLAPNSKTLLPVSCVEQGRWDHTNYSSSFAPSKVHSYARLRRLQAEQTVAAARVGAERRASQSAVWAEVATKHREAAVSNSATGAMGDVYAGRRPSIDHVLRTFSKPEARQTGVLCLIECSPVALDAFDRPSTLAKMWSRLVSGYAMDAVGSLDGEIEPGVAEEFISIARAADWSEHRGVALGTDVVCTTPGIVGTALSFEDGIAHLALFGRSPRGSFASRGARPRTHFHS